MKSGDYRYSDVDFNFFTNPITDDVSKRVDNNAIKQSLYNLIMMRKFDVPFHPEVNSQINDSLFDVNTPLTRSMIQRATTYTIENFEPRVELDGVDVTSNSLNPNQIDVTIRYRIVATGEAATYTIAINSAR